MAGHPIEALWSLLIPALDLGSQVSRPVADRIGFEVIESSVVPLLPDLELRFLLENPDEDRLLGSHALPAEEHHRILRQGLQMGRQFNPCTGREQRRRDKNDADVDAAHGPPFPGIQAEHRAPGARSNRVAAFGEESINATAWALGREAFSLSREAVDRPSAAHECG